MNCLKCERVLSLLSPTAFKLIANGGRMNVEFGHGSDHDRDVAVAFVCDDCYERHNHLFQVTSTTCTPFPVSFTPISVVPLTAPEPPESDRPAEVRS